MKLTSPAFRNGEAIPIQYTCDGKDVSPPLVWEDIPKGAQSLALIVDDPDAPGRTWVHWIFYNLSSSVIKLEDGAGRKGVPVYTHSITGVKAMQGKNDFGDFGYGGPCPPSGRHRYSFKLYALDAMLDLPSGSTKAELEKAMKGHILGEPTQLLGTYER
ncbi:MAG: hypothetical protein A2987_05470 [Omnitrophica bacterium RIFCSPLOWO2_01_FULL_45_10]|nr:MAG: hypothetical protein A2987_05470 [Omnitrophica bacterium RIFCSPLOWO2_01_FULL_45_10]